MHALSLLPWPRRSFKIFVGKILTAFHTVLTLHQGLLPLLAQVFTCSDCAKESILLYLSKKNHCLHTQETTVLQLYPGDLSPLVLRRVLHFACGLERSSLYPCWERVFHFVFSKREHLATVILGRAPHCACV